MPSHPEPKLAPQAAAAPGPTPQTENEPGRPRKRWLNKLTLATVAALLALATGGANLVYLLWPDLRADPGLQHSAHITVLAMDKNVLYRRYLRRPGSTPSPRRVDPDANGNVFYLQMEMEGFKGKRAKLRWFTYDANNGDRLSRPFSTGHSFKAKAPTAKSISEEWVPLPAEGTFSIRFELYDGSDVLLAFADSPKFTAFKT